MSPLASTKPNPAAAAGDVLRTMARRVNDWWREPVPQRGVYIQHSGGWGQHSGTRC